MRQTIATSQSGLLGAMNIAIQGGTTNSATVVLAHNTVAAMTAARIAAVDARDAREAGKEDLRQLRELLETERVATKEFAALARDQLKPTLGRLHNSAWNVTGFQGSLRIPKKAADLEVLAEAFKGYLEDNPDKEIAAHNITAVAAAARYNALANARAAVIAQEGAVETLVQNADASFGALDKMLRALVKELAQLIPPLDGRWTTFGFNKPGAKERPETPTNIAATVVAGNGVFVKWDAAARAEYYRIWMRIVGLGTELGVVGTAADLDFLLESLPANSLVEIALSALNNGGESPRSEVIAVQTA